MNTIAIIPARGGSKGIYRKNIVKIGNIPLIGFTIMAAKKSKYLNKIIVSTDDKEIMEISKKYQVLLKMASLHPRILKKKLQQIGSLKRIRLLIVWSLYREKNLKF